MTTPSDICLDALKKANILGVGQVAQPEDINDAYTDLQDMLAQWQRKRWMVWNLIDTGLVSTGQQSYTVGTGGDFNIVRPDRLEDAYVRLPNSSPNPVDLSLQILQAREDYDRVTLKQLVSLPWCIFYDAAYPTGLVYPYPIPNASIYEIHIVTKVQLGFLTSIGQLLNLPPEYIPALKFNLAVRLRSFYGRPADPALIGLAKDALNLIRNANTQIPMLVMPRDLTGNSVYNIFSDNPNN